MDLVTQLVERLQTSQASFNLLHLVVQNWIVFQRDSFDIFDDYGDPFTTQVFLIEIYSGRYIHRAQGSKVDFGASLDVNVLFTKLTEAFVDFKVCQGFMVNADVGKPTNRRLQEFPYERITAKKCQYLYKPARTTPFKIDGRKPRFRWICPACQELGEFDKETRNESDPDSMIVNPTKSVLGEDADFFSILEEECPVAQEVNFGEENLSPELYHELGDYKCVTCQEPCLTYYDLMLHNYKKHDQALEQLQPQTNGLEAIPLPDGKVEYKRVNFACQHCDAIYTGDTSWTKHMREKHSWDLFECKACDETCHYAADFSAHMLTYHPDKPEIKCPTQGCSHVSNLKEDPEHFNEHFRNCLTQRRTGYHAVDKFAAQCDKCGKKYATKRCFDAHLKQHQGFELYKCAHCDYGTNHKAVLVDHEKVHLREKGLTNADTDLVLYHQCEKCDKKFSKKHVLLAHMKRTHEGVPIYRACVLKNR
ncbi:hypothetical protein TCAL_16588 [Tigriopus californicus]|uniref:C2H2-type domain-containing protein n=1 Tax=Tigriopus californicus TaxID=6832 RepID=A0A553NDU3_TIGCA|nr:hypothetical protein TCAL_16588 [Tigriopus californicus]